MVKVHTQMWRSGMRGETHFCDSSLHADSILPVSSEPDLPPTTILVAENLPLPHHCGFTPVRTVIGFRV